MSVGASASSAAGTVLDKFRLHGRTIVITGCEHITAFDLELRHVLNIPNNLGARGLGLNFARALSEAGANIAGIDVAKSPHPDFDRLSEYGGRAAYYQ